VAVKIPADVRELFRQCPFREVRAVIPEGTAILRSGEVSKCFAIDKELGFPAGSVGVHESTCAACVLSGEPGSLENEAFKVDISSAAIGRIGSGTCPTGTSRDVIISKALAVGAGKERLRLALIRGVSTVERLKAEGRIDPVNPLTEEEAMRLATEYDLLEEVAP